MRVRASSRKLPLAAVARLLLGYPPGCPFHFHAAPDQFIAVLSPEGVPTDEARVRTVTGVLEPTGQNEGGIFYRLRDARAGG